MAQHSPQCPAAHSHPLQQTSWPGPLSQTSLQHQVDVQLRQQDAELEIVLVQVIGTLDDRPPLIPAVPAQNTTSLGWMLLQPRQTPS